MNDRKAVFTETLQKGNVAFDLLAERHGAEFARDYYREKVLHRPLFLKPTPQTDPPAETARDKRQKAQEAAKLKKRKSPGKPRPLSAKQKRALQIYAIPKDQQKYEIYVPLHNLWCQYMRDILSLEKSNKDAETYGRHIEPKGAGSLLASADYHGALVEVVRSRCVSRVGVRGIVVRDTRSTFEIITPKNQLKVMPKEHTVFRFEIPLRDVLPETALQNGDAQTNGDKLKPIVLELNGSSFEFRATDRATRRAKVIDMKPSEINS